MCVCVCGVWCVTYTRALTYSFLLLKFSNAVGDIRVDVCARNKESEITIIANLSKFDNLFSLSLSLFLALALALALSHKHNTDVI